MKIRQSLRSENDREKFKLGTVGKKGRRRSKSNPEKFKSKKSKSRLIEKILIEIRFSSNREMDLNEDDFSPTANDFIWRIAGAGGCCFSSIELRKFVS